MDDPEHIIVTGATGGIGQALVQAILQRWPEATLYAVGRDCEKLENLRMRVGATARLKTLVYDLSQEAEGRRLGDYFLLEIPRVDRVFHTLGVLNGRGLRPEKSLLDIDAEALTEAFHINVASTLWLARALKPVMRHRSPSAFLILSAKVGSIGDNNLGGWYSYRLSKAALNMAVRNISLEFKRSGCAAAVVAVHPGTTLTDFSKDYVGSWPDGKVATAEVTAMRLVELSHNVGAEESGKFLHWDGSELPW